VEEPDVQPHRPPRQPRPSLDRDGPLVGDPDIAAEEELGTAASDLEEAGVFQEERPLLRKEESEAGQVVLYVIDLDLGEVGVDRGVEREALGQLDLGVAPHLRGVGEALVSRLVVPHGLLERVGRHAHQALRRGAQARSTKQKARKQRIEELQQIGYDRGQSVSLALADRRVGKKVLTATNLSKQFNGQPVFKKTNVALEPGDRIGIIGPNGVGKSTLLDILAGKLAPDSGQVEWGETVHLGYYDQQSAGLVDSMRVIDFIEQEAPLIRTKDGERMSAFQVLEWFLFPKPQQYAQIGTLSGGERRRLYLLYVLMHRPNVLFLDEPTNDLDIQTLNVLEEFLDHFNGSLIIVSHDRYFLDRTTEYLMTFENGQLSRRYPAPFSTYQQLRNEAKVERPQKKPTTVEKETQPKARQRKLSWMEQRELAQLEARIETLENQQQQLQNDINASGDDYLKLQTLAQQLQQVEQELESAMQRWIELSEITV